MNITFMKTVSRNRRRWTFVTAAVGVVVVDLPYRFLTMHFHLLFCKDPH